MPAPRKITRATYRILRLLLERDDGTMYGLKIARNLPLWQPAFLPPRWPRTWPLRPSPSN